MGRLFPFLQSFWGAVVFVFIVGAVTHRLFGPCDFSHYMAGIFTLYLA